MEESYKKNIETKKKPARRKYIIAAGIIFLCIFAGLVYRVMTWEPKPDPESEAKIRQEIAKKLLSKTGLKINPNNLTEEDFAQIDNLELGSSLMIGFPPGPSHISRELSDIRLLEKLINLRYLSINSVKYPSNKIPKWMSLLAKPGFFNLEERFALDLSPLKKLNNLETLIIFTKVDNLKPLENLTNLQELWLSDKLVNELEHVKKLKNLKILFIEGSQLSDLEPVKGLKNLQYLYILHGKYISDEQIEDLQKALPDLEITTEEKKILDITLKAHMKMFLDK